MRVLVDGSRLSDDMTFFFLSFFLSLISSTQSLFWSRKKKKYILSLCFYVNFRSHFFDWYFFFFGFFLVEFCFQFYSLILGQFKIELHDFFFSVKWSRPHDLYYGPEKLTQVNISFFFSLIFFSILSLGVGFIENWASWCSLLYFLWD
jgi:hypothetical protein